MKSVLLFPLLIFHRKDQFYEITRKHAVSPWKISSIEHQLGEKLPDFTKWSRDGQMDLNDSKRQIQNWDKSFK